MARRGENIYRRKDGRWEGRYIKGRKPDGRPLFGSVYGRSYTEVKKRLNTLKAAHCDQGLSARCTRPFREYLLEYLAEQQAGGIKPSSYGCYYRMVHNHILPGLGGVPMHRLDAAQIQQFLSALHSQGLSDYTIQNIFRYLRGAVRAAVKCGKMSQDICGSLSPAKPRPKAVHALTPSQQQRLERAALAVIRESGARSGAEVMVALYTGMRVGEICALRWQDVDFESNLIHVKHTLQRLNLHENGAKTAVRLGTPKSESSLRSIPMGEQLSRLLQEIRPLAQGDFVVTGRLECAEPRVLQYRFERLLERAELPRMGFHALRHSFATRCMELNIDVATISKLLGHSSAKLTLDVYTDSFLEHRRAAMSKLDSIAAA